ncbi:hypothetical protein STEPF1_07158 [Streptomyces sp. F-1]|nr:hypothetical protein STEPF1_07158 [Streptomyces sp. F-1]
MSPGSGSTTLPVTDQPSGWSPVISPRTVTVTGTVVPGGTTPSPHWSEAASQTPPGKLILVTVTPVGGATVSRVPGEAAGPLSTTSTRTSVELPTGTGEAVSGACTARSTDCCTPGSF